MNHPPPLFLEHRSPSPITPADPLAGVKLFPWSKPMSNATAKCPNHDSESEGQILASTPSVSNHFFRQFGWLQKNHCSKKKSLKKSTTHNSQLNTTHILSPKRTVITFHMVSQLSASIRAAPQLFRQSSKPRCRGAGDGDLGTASNWIISPGRDEDKKSNIET